MIKEYFINLFDIIKNCFLPFRSGIKKGFIKYVLSIWGLIAVQILSGIPSVIILNENSLSVIDIKTTLILIICILFFTTSFFFMFKFVFDYAGEFFNKEKLTNLKVVKSLLIIGLINLIPFIIYTTLAPVIPYYWLVRANIIFLVFNLIYYLSLSLTLASIVFFRDKNSIVAIWQGVKVFYKKILYSFPLFIIFYFLGHVIVFLLGAIIFAIMLYFNILNENRVIPVHEIIKIYTLYVLAPLYIGIQCGILKKSDEMNE